MLITVITVAKNEEVILPFFFRHYERFADHIIVYDNESTDRTAELVKAHPKAEYCQFNTQGEFRDSALTYIKNEMYKSQEGDWYIVVDCDEFVWNKDMRVYLEKCDREGITIPLIAAFDMIGREVPADDGKTQLWELIDDAFRQSFYDKRAVFSKEVDIRYEPGCHRANPRGTVKYSENHDIFLLHFAWLSEEYRIAKAEVNAKAMSAENKWSGWSTHYLDIPGLRKYYQDASRETRKLNLKWGE
jgi:glycosyltransferase involved in cell wall biosynthesis